MSDPAPTSRPAGRPAMFMHWRELLFMHWPVPAETLRPLVPACFDIDTHDGQAWVGLVPFTMRGVRHRGLPPVPTLHSFHECNVRTYVRCAGQPCVWFFSLDAASRLAVLGARWLWNLNYVNARMSLTRNGDEVDYKVQRKRDAAVGLRCRWRTGKARESSRQGDLDHFLTERYALVTCDRRGRPRRGRIWHQRWQLRDAELLDLDDGLVAAAGIELGDAKPAVVFAGDPVNVMAWWLEAVG